jgi:hypothetical protein
MTPALAWDILEPQAATAASVVNVFQKALKFCRIHPINLIRSEIEDQQDGY